MMSVKVHINATRIPYILRPKQKHHFFSCNSHLLSPCNSLSKQWTDFNSAQPAVLLTNQSFCNRSLFSFKSNGPSISINTPTQLTFHLFVAITRKFLMALSLMGVNVYVRKLQEFPQLINKSGKLLV